MCYNTRVTRKAKQLEDYYEVERLLGQLNIDDELTYNTANGFMHPNMWIIPQEKPKNMIPVMWGLIPYYTKNTEPKEYYKETIKWGSGLNAKSEKLFDSNNYKTSALKRRCIIPVDGFYEPHTAKKNGKNFSIPFYFESKNNSPLSLAGIYAVNQDKTVTFSILTKAATPLFSKIHNKKNRRPVILKEDSLEAWLNGSLEQNDINIIINNDLSDENISTWPISKDLYKQNGEGDRPDIIKKIDYEELDISY